MPGFSTFSLPKRIIFGGHSISELPAELRRLKARRTLLVTDRYFSSTDTFLQIVASLKDAEIESFVCNDVQPDPTLENVESGLQLLHSIQAEVVVAIGGGSSLDCAKAICCLARNPAPLSNYVGYHKIPNPGLPLIVVPTTAGTGSEATKVAVITDTGNNVKMMILDDHLLPTVAIVDYELTFTMPASLTAAVGVDTLTHAIEAYVSKRASALTDPIALSCAHLVSKYLRRAWSDPQDREAREGMSAAACQGGMAFSNSSVCLVHGMSRPIGAVFHVPHGLSNAVLLPPVTRFSIPGATKRYAQLARSMDLAGDKDCDEVAAKKLVEGLEDLNQDLNIPRLGALKEITPERFADNVAKMAQDALDSGSPANNPVVPNIGEITTLYQSAY